MVSKCTHNAPLLRAVMAYKGETIAHLKTLIHMSQSAFSSRTRGVGGFSDKEADILADALSMNEGLKNAVFYPTEGAYFDCKYIYKKEK
jgi:hypothetical protein